MKRDQKRRKRIEAAGIDYECPEIVRSYTLVFFFPVNETKIKKDIVVKCHSWKLSVYGFPFFISI